MFRCLSPFKIGIHISLEQSVWAELSWNSFRKCIASIFFDQTLHFEDLAVQNYLFLKDVCIHWWTNLKLFNKALLMSVKFFFLNILKTTHDRVRESVKNALSRTLLHLVFKIFKKKNFTIIKSAFKNNLRFCTNECKYLLKTSNFGPQGPQNAALQQRYSPC